MNCLKRLQRFLASVVFVTFFVTNTLTPAPVAHASTEVFGHGSQISDFKIPAEFGKVAEIIRPDGGEQNNSKPGAPSALLPPSSVLIHIQEAHANYDAQINIKNILEHLSKNYGVKLVLVEGAANKLRPGLFNFFPEDKELNQTITDSLMKAGQLTGVEVFMIDESSATDNAQRATNTLTVDRRTLRAPEAFGVENADAYLKDREAYRKVHEGRKLAESFLEAFYRQWQKSSDRVLSKSLREFLGRECDFEEERLPLQDWMAFLKTAVARDLKLDLDDVSSQRDWPVLVRYFRLKSLEGKIDTAKVEKEKEKFFADIQKQDGGWRMQDGAKRQTQNALRPPSSAIQDVKNIFDSASKHDLPVYKTRFVFERLMDALPKDFSFDAYPTLRLQIQQMILMSELQGERLQEEIKKLTKLLAENLAVKSEEKRLAGALREYQLLRKLFRLELSREEYQKIKSRDINPNSIALRLQTTDQRPQTKNKRLKSQVSSLESLFEEALKFYSGAIDRENQMMENVTKILGSRKDKKAVLITGGFHTEGFKEKITASGASYIGITPNIGEIRAEDQPNYLRALLGPETRDNRQQTAQRATVNVQRKDKKSVIASEAKPSHLSSPVPNLKSPVHERSELGFPLASAEGFAAAFEPAYVASRRSEMREIGRQVIAFERPDRVTQLWEGYDAQLAAAFQVADAAITAVRETLGPDVTRRELAAEGKQSPPRSETRRKPVDAEITQELSGVGLVSASMGALVRSEVRGRQQQLFQELNDSDPDVAAAALERLKRWRDPQAPAVDLEDSITSPHEKWVVKYMASPEALEVFRGFSFVSPETYVRTAASFVLGGVQIFFRQKANGHLFMDPMPGSGYFQRYYDDTYFEGYLHDGTYLDRESGKRKSAQNILRFMEENRPDPDVSLKGMKVLEVGAGAGFLLDEGKKRYQWDAEGVEMVPELVRNMKKLGIKVHQGLFEKLVFDRSGYDMVILKDVLEHTSNPEEILAKVGQVVKPGGVIFVEIPLMDKYGVRFGLLEHVQGFTKQSIQDMLAAHGFSLRKIEITEQKNGEHPYEEGRIVAVKRPSGKAPQAADVTRSEAREMYETRRAGLEQMADERAFVPLLGFAAVKLYNAEHKEQILIEEAATNPEIQAKVLAWAIKKHGAKTIPAMMDLNAEHEAVILANLSPEKRAEWTATGKLHVVNGKETIIPLHELADRPQLHMTLQAAGIDWRSLKDVDPATTGRLGLAVETLKKLDAKAGANTPKIAYSIAPYTLVAFLMGDNEAMLAMMDREDGIRDDEGVKMFEAVFHYSERLIAANAERLIKEGGADIVVFLDPRPTGMVSPEQFLKYSVDPVNRLSRQVRHLGALSAAHPCRPQSPDDAEKKLPFMVRYDVDALSVDSIYLLPEVYDAVQEANLYERKPVILGNMDTLSILPTEHPKVIRHDAHWIFKIMGKRPFIFCSSCDIDTTPENMLAFSGAAAHEARSLRSENRLIREMVEAVAAVFRAFVGGLESLVAYHPATALKLHKNATILVFKDAFGRRAELREPAIVPQGVDAGIHKGKTVFVTGGRGYIAGAVIRALLDAGSHVIAFDNEEKNRSDLPTHPNLVYIKGDIRDPQAVQKAMKGADAVVHLAAYIEAGVSVNKPAMFFNNNVIGTTNVLDAMAANGIQTLAFASSAGVYSGKDLKGEDSLTEAVYPDPQNPYGETKLMMEKLMADYGKKGIRFGALRFFNAAGALKDHGEDHKPETHLLPLIMYAALGARDSVSLFGDDYETPDGTNIRDYIHIEDLTNAHLRMLAHLYAGRPSQIVNLGTGKGTSVKDAVVIVRNVSGRPVTAIQKPRRTGDPAILRAGHDLATQVLGWIPLRDFLRIVQDAWEYHSKLQAPEKQEKASPDTDLSTEPADLLKVLEGIRANKVAGSEVKFEILFRLFVDSFDRESKIYKDAKVLLSREGVVSELFFDDREFQREYLAVYEALKRSSGAKVQALFKTAKYLNELVVETVRHPDPGSRAESRGTEPTEKQRAILDRFGLSWDPQTGNIVYTERFKPLQLKSKIIFVRHGETELMALSARDGKSRYQGTADTSLNRLTIAGREQADAAVPSLEKLLAGDKVFRFFVSPLTRARQTAEPFEKRFGIRAKVRSGLREMSYGRFENFKNDEIRVRYGEEAHRESLSYRVESNALLRVGGGQSFVEFLGQVADEILEIDRILDGKTGVIFGHATSGAALRILLGQPSAGQVRWREKFPAAASAFVLYSPSETEAAPDSSAAVSRSETRRTEGRFMVRVMVLAAGLTLMTGSVAGTTGIWGGSPLIKKLSVAGMLTGGAILITVIVRDQGGSRKRTSHYGRSEMRAGEPDAEHQVSTKEQLVGVLKRLQEAGQLLPKGQLEIDVAGDYGVQVGPDEFLVVKHTGGEESEGTILRWHDQRAIDAWLPLVMSAATESSTTAASAPVRAKQVSGPQAAVLQKLVQGNNIEIFPVEGRERELASVKAPLILKSGERSFFVKVIPTNSKAPNNPFGFGGVGGILTESLSKKSEFSVVMIVVSEWQRQQAAAHGRLEVRGEPIVVKVPRVSDKVETVATFLKTRLVRELGAPAEDLGQYGVTKIEFANFNNVPVKFRGQGKRFSFDAVPLHDLDSFLQKTFGNNLTPFFMEAVLVREEPAMVAPEAAARLIKDQVPPPTNNRGKHQLIAINVDDLGPAAPVPPVSVSVSQPSAPAPAAPANGGRKKLVLKKRAPVAPRFTEGNRPSAASPAFEARQQAKAAAAQKASANKKRIGIILAAAGLVIGGIVLVLTKPWEKQKSAVAPAASPASSQSPAPAPRSEVRSAGEVPAPGSFVSAFETVEALVWTLLDQKQRFFRIALEGAGRPKFFKAPRNLKEWNAMKFTLLYAAMEALGPQTDFTTMLAAGPAGAEIKIMAEQRRSEMRQKKGVGETDHAVMDAWRHHLNGFGSRRREGEFKPGLAGLRFIPSADPETNGSNTSGNLAVQPAIREAGAASGLRGHTALRPQDREQPTHADAEEVLAKGIFEALYRSTADLQEIAVPERPGLVLPPFDPANPDGGVKILKPSAGRFPFQTIKEILKRFEENGYIPGAVKVFSTRELKRLKMMGEHYGAIYQVAEQGLNALNGHYRNEVFRLYEKKFGEKPDPSLILGGLQVEAALGISPRKTLELWDRHKGEFVRLGDGIKMLMLELPKEPGIPTEHIGGKVALLNGFAGAMFADYEMPGNRIAVILMRGVPGRAKPVSFMRRHVVGATDPAEAEAGTIRNDMLLGKLRVENPATALANGIHFSDENNQTREVTHWFPEHVNRSESRISAKAGEEEVRAEVSDLSQTPGHDLIQKLFELKTLNKSFAEDLITPDKVEETEAFRKELIAAVKEMVFRLSCNLMYELLTHRRLYRAIARALGRELLAIENDFLPNPLLRYLNERSLPESRYNAWEHIAFNNVFLDVLIQIARVFDQYLQNKETWIQKNRPDLLGKRILYFSAEFGMKSLQIYGGGLGILSGDHVRGSSDIGLDGFQAVGLLYKKGYFRQVITKDGRQEVDETYEGISFGNLPLEAVKDPQHPEQDFILPISFPDHRIVRAKVWKTVYGKTSMYLLDTDVEGNSDTDRTITRELYRGNGESKERLEQYYVLGAGGMMAMRALGKEPDVLHLNDCHPVFSALQLIASTMKEIAETVKDPKQRFEMALLKASAKTVFTTHTPIAAGNEAPSLDVMRPFLESIFEGDRYAVDRILSLGILDGRFNIAAFSQRVSEFHNGVSELHGHVSQAMWKRLYPGVKLDAVPIPGIVNSVHTPYWQIPEIAELFKRTFEDPEVKRLMEAEDPAELKKKLEDPAWADEHIKVDDKRLWSIHFERKQKLLTELEIRLGRRLQRNEAQRANPDEVRFLAQFDPGALTIGFARRAIPYKRMTLAFQDVKRLARIAVKAGKPIQFVFGGKAHPKDRDSQELIRKLHGLARRAIDEAVAEEEAQHPERKGMIKPEQALIKFHFLEEYNVDIARYLESGVDVWLNAPVRPLEASGTSGMKAAMNGVLNLSICDGWSAEGIVHGMNGWIFGIRGGERNDMADAEDFYRKLEEVVDTYYNQPGRWIRMAKASIVSTSYWFGMERMLRDYARLMYAPAVAHGEKMAETEVYARAAQNLKIREAILAHPTAWQQAVVENFPAHAVTGKEVEMSVILPTDGLPPEYFAVDLILDGMKGTRWEGMDRIEKIEDGKYRYVVKFKPEETDFYRKAKFRITPSNPRIWLNPEELDYVTRYIDTPAGLNIYDESLLKFRAESPVEQGMLFFVQIPDEVGVRQMQWTGDPVKWDLADASFGMQRVKDGLWAIVVPEEFLKHQPVKFKFYMNMPEGHFVGDQSLLWLTGTYPVREGNAQVYLNPEDPFFNREKARDILAAVSDAGAPAGMGRSEVRVDQTGRAGSHVASKTFAREVARDLSKGVIDTEKNNRLIESAKTDKALAVFAIGELLRLRAGTQSGEVSREALRISREIRFPEGVSQTSGAAAATPRSEAREAEVRQPSSRPGLGYGGRQIKDRVLAGVRSRSEARQIRVVGNIQATEEEGGRPGILAEMDVPFGHYLVHFAHVGDETDFVTKATFNISLWVEAHEANGVGFRPDAYFGKVVFTIDGEGKITASQMVEWKPANLKRVSPAPDREFILGIQAWVRDMVGNALTERNIVRDPKETLKNYAARAPFLQPEPAPRPASVPAEPASNTAPAPVPPANTASVAPPASAAMKPAASATVSAPTKAPAIPVSAVPATPPTEQGDPVIAAAVKAGFSSATALQLDMQGAVEVEGPFSLGELSEILNHSGLDGYDINAMGLGDPSRPAGRAWRQLPDNMDLGQWVTTQLRLVYPTTAVVPQFRVIIVPYVSSMTRYGHMAFITPVPSSAVPAARSEARNSTAEQLAALKDRLEHPGRTVSGTPQNPNSLETTAFGLLYGDSLVIQRGGKEFTRVPVQVPFKETTYTFTFSLEPVAEKKELILAAAKRLIGEGLKTVPAPAKGLSYKDLFEKRPPGARELFLLACGKYFKWWDFAADRSGRLIKVNYRALGLERPAQKAVSGDVRSEVRVSSEQEVFGVAGKPLSEIMGDMEALNSELAAMMREYADQSAWYYLTAEHRDYAKSLSAMTWAQFLEEGKKYDEWRDFTRAIRYMNENLNNIGHVLCAPLSTAGNSIDLLIELLPEGRAEFEKASEATDGYSLKAIAPLFEKLVRQFPSDNDEAQKWIKIVAFKTHEMQYAREVFRRWALATAARSEARLVPGQSVVVEVKKSAHRKTDGREVGLHVLWNGEKGFIPRDYLANKDISAYSEVKALTVRFVKRQDRGDLIFAEAWERIPPQELARLGLQANTSGPRAPVFGRSEARDVVNGEGASKGKWYFESATGMVQHNISAAEYQEREGRRSEIRALTKDRVRTVDQAEWFFPEDIDRTIAGLAAAVRQAEAEDKPVRFAAVSKSSDQDDLLGMFGFVTATPRADAERAFIEGLPARLRNDPKATPMKNGDQITILFNNGETAVLNFLKGPSVKTFGEWIAGELSSNQRQTGVNSFEAMIQKSRFSLHDRLPLTFTLVDTAVLAQETGVELTAIQKAVVTQAEYDKLPAVVPVAVPVPEPVQRSIETQKPAIPQHIRERLGYFSREIARLRQGPASAQALSALESDVHGVDQALEARLVDIGSSKILDSSDEVGRLLSQHPDFQKTHLTEQQLQRMVRKYFTGANRDMAARALKQRFEKKTTGPETVRKIGEGLAQIEKQLKMLERSPKVRARDLQILSQQVESLYQKLTVYFTSLATAEMETPGFAVQEDIANRLWFLMAVLGALDQTGPFLLGFLQRNPGEAGDRQFFYFGENGERAPWEKPLSEEQTTQMAGALEKFGRYLEGISEELQAAPAASYLPLMRGALRDLSSEAMALSQKRPMAGTEAIALSFRAKEWIRFIGGFLGKNGHPYEQVLQEKIPEGIALASQLAGLVEVGNESPRGTRSEMRVPPLVVPILETRMADDGWRKARKPELHPPSSIHHPKTFSETIVTEMTYGEFVARYTKESGASEEAMRKVVKMLNGIAPLQANDYNAIEAFAREFILDSGLLKDALKMAEAKRFAAARARLGVKTIEGVDALILTKQVAFDQNALLAVQKVFSGTRVVVFIENENDLSEADRSFLAKLPEASRPLILLSDRLDDARKLLGLEAAGRALNLKAMVWGIETLPAALVRQLSDRIVLNTQRLESFLSVAGVSQLVSAMQAQYQATARAA